MKSVLSFFWLQPCYPPRWVCKYSDHHCSALVLLLQYNAGPCLESSRGCLQHSLQAALHRPPGCKSASVYFAKFVHSCRERRTAPQLAAGSAALQLSQLGRSWSSAAAGSCAAALQSVLQTQYLAPCTLQVRWTEYSRIL